MAPPSIIDARGPAPTIAARASTLSLAPTGGGAAEGEGPEGPGPEAGVMGGVASAEGESAAASAASEKVAVAAAEGEAPAGGGGEVAPEAEGPLRDERGDRVPASAAALLGATIEGRYVVEELIGGGNIGLVYRARHKVIGKTVAVKLLRPDFARDDEV
ncbi:MAG TPA: hypothetical protein VFS43_44865, partial [Polyangiaceae bacterium]|nr:hypothetical protein [Polyangiaceae bacterium]